MTYERSGPAHSGNRPRFKRRTSDFRGSQKNVNDKSKVRRVKEEEEEEQERDETSKFTQQSHSRNKRTIAKLSVLLIASILAISNHLIKHASASTPTLSNFKSNSNNSNNNNDHHHRISSRERRSAVPAAAAAAPSRHFMTTIDEDIAMQVGAFASKLEHWLNCQRLATVTPTQLEREQQQQEAAAATADRKTKTTDNNNNNGMIRQHEREALESGASFCAAHYDGHVCWPPTRASQTAQLACPQLSWHLASISRDKWRHLTSSETSSNLSRQDSPDLSATNDKSPIQSTTDCKDELQGQMLSADGNSRMARRACQQQQDNSLVWQPEPDYSQCKPSGRQADGKEPQQQFDPTDNWIHLDSSPADRALFEALVVELERSIEGGFDPYGDPDLLEQWTLCIGNIMREQQEKAAESARLRLHNNNNNNSEDKLQQRDQLYCPIIFDGWRCWPATKAGETAYVGCPSNQPGFTAERQAHKICTQNGTWYRHPETNRYWSNYTTCVDTVDLAFRTKILKIYVIGNTISLVALLLSLIIFMTFKSLKCTRVTIHKNLFLSFITNNLMWIIWYTYVVSDATLLQSNPIECRLWHIVLHYFLVSNYFWMFCEGLYLHTLLVVAFVSEDKILKWFYILGWLTPLPITIAYAYNRSYDSQHTHFCWMEESPYNLILMSPIGVSLLLNLIFLINIVRLLVTKLRANNTPDAHQTRKAVRATLFLIPLLGLHYILTPFRPEPKSEWEFIYEIITAVCTSFQGLCVAMLFCFCNGEVMAVLRKKLDDKLWASEGFESH